MLMWQMKLQVLSCSCLEENKWHCDIVSLLTLTILLYFGDVVLSMMLLTTKLYPILIRRQND